jgi:hypothetical protein
LKPVDRAEAGRKIRWLIANEYMVFESEEAVEVAITDLINKGVDRDAETSTDTTAYKEQ